MKDKKYFKIYFSFVNNTYNTDLDLFRKFFKKKTFINIDEGYIYGEMKINKKGMLDIDPKSILFDIRTFSLSIRMSKREQKEVRDKGNYNWESELMKRRLKIVNSSLCNFYSNLKSDEEGILEKEQVLFFLALMKLKDFHFSYTPFGYQIENRYMNSFYLVPERIEKDWNIKRKDKLSIE